MIATLTASTRLICPAPIASVAHGVGEHDGVRLDVRADAPREPQRDPILGGGWRLVTTWSPSGTSGVHGGCASATKSRS